MREFNMHLAGFYEDGRVKSKDIVYKMLQFIK